MNKFIDKNNPDICEGSDICGYCVKKLIEIKQIGFFLYELEHSDTGAKHLHISNNDRENTFGVAFKTVPADSTGVAHILEHTVLCGSAKFPVRDPFFSMLKRSLSTFMNAFTASDWTMYPFSTQNKKDFYNLMDVYLDAAFFPNISELSFKQEGCRIEQESEKLVYKGVVYNEMKGAMSSPDQVLGRSLLKTMYPNTTYRHNSGGEPSEIPKLTYNQLKNFHEQHYHPSNAFFYTYGNISLKEHLVYINDRVLKHFKRIDPKTDVPSQPRWSEPTKAVFSYPLGKNENPSKKCQICVAWLMADITDSFEILALALLARILLGNSASPMHKALIDSGLGTALCDATGFDADNKDSLFACGLKDVAESDAIKIETIVFDVLNNLFKNGIDKKLIESAIHQLEFHRKEITNTPHPYGIKLCLAIVGMWMHGGNPEKVLQFDDDLQKLNKKLSEGPFFENQIKKYFLNNSHRALFTLVPDQTMQEKEDNRVVAELDAIKISMTDIELKKISQEAEALKHLQESNEDVSCLPTLEIEDIPSSVPSVQASKSSANCVCYEQQTSGIFYFSAAAGVAFLPKHLLSLVPFFCYALPKIGTKIHDYAEIAQLIDEYTGGIGLSSQACANFANAEICVPFVSFGGKCLVRNIEKMFSIIEELVCKFDFSDTNRLKNLLLEYRAGMESMILHNGHRLAMSLASRNFSTSCGLNETWHGIHQLQTIKNITNNLSDKKLESVAADLFLIGRKIFTQNNVKTALIGESKVISDAIQYTTSIQNQFNQRVENGFELKQINCDDKIQREGWSTSSSISFVASAFETVRMEHEDAPALSVISKLLRSLYLHREIREKGGAYGGFAIYNSENGIFCFGSYRDPHIVSTLRVYDNALTFIKSGNYKDEDIKEAVLQVCSEIDKPDPPGPASKKAFYRNLISLSDEARDRFKKRLLKMTRAQIKKAADRYFDKQKRQHSVAVISSEEKLKQANEQKPMSLYKI